MGQGLNGVPLPSVLRWQHTILVARRINYKGVGLVKSKYFIVVYFGPGAVSLAQPWRDISGEFNH
jgi:hypothetical protein